MFPHDQLSSHRSFHDEVSFLNKCVARFLPSSILQAYIMQGSSDDNNYCWHIYNVAASDQKTSHDYSYSNPSYTIEMCMTLLDSEKASVFHKKNYNSSLDMTSKSGLECSQCLIDAGLIEMAFGLLDFGVSSRREFGNNGDKLSVLLVLGSSFKLTRVLAIITCTEILDRVCHHSERTCRRIQRMDDNEVSVLNEVIAQSRTRYDNPTFLAAVQVLSHRAQQSLESTRLLPYNHTVVRPSFTTSAVFLPASNHPRAETVGIPYCQGILAEVVFHCLCKPQGHDQTWRRSQEEPRYNE